MRTHRVSRLIVAAAVAAAACGPDGGPTHPGTPEPIFTGLKEIVIPNLPAPYYHFEYDPAGHATFVSFASELTRYHLSYTGERLTEMRNDILVNHDRLAYVYDDRNRVALIRESDEAGDVFMVVRFTYSGSQLVAIERDRSAEGGFIVDKEMTLSYYPDGNLRELAVHRPAIAGFQDEQRYADLYEEYDTTVNVDGFALLHEDFFDHLVLLPEVQLQRGNPHRVTRTGDGLNFVSDYTFSFDGEGRPLERTGQVTVTNGPTAGQQFQSGATFTYYQ